MQDALRKSAPPTASKHANAGTVLGPHFFDRPTLRVAKSLLGKYLVRRMGGKTNAFMITETEAYFGFKDKGSHAYRGQPRAIRRCSREPGTIYVYFTYGMHWMVNLVCHGEGFPAAVLIRGLASPDRRAASRRPGKAHQIPCYRPLPHRQAPGQTRGIVGGGSRPTHAPKRNRPHAEDRHPRSRHLDRRSRGGSSARESG